MRNSIAFIMICAFPFFLIAQTQLDVQGNAASTDTVARIKVNFSGNANIVGLAVSSVPSSGWGIGGYFKGGAYGLWGKSDMGQGVLGESLSSIGVVGLSTSGLGVYGQSNGYTGVRGQSIHGIGVNGESSNGYGVYGFSTTSNGVFGSSTYNEGVRGFSTNSSGVYGESSTGFGVEGQSTDTYGVRGYSINSIGVRGGSTNSYGVAGVSTNSYGVYGYSKNHFGVYGASDSDVGISGFSITGQGLRGYCSSNIGVVGYSGNAASFDFNAEGPGMNYGATSSRRWKHDIENISDPIAMISKLRGVYFNWDAEHGSQHDIGFIAEEIGAVLPEIVSYEENGTDATSMDYSKMTPLLVEAVNAMRKEYQEKFEKQQAQMDALTHEIEAIKALFIKNAKGSIGVE